MFRIHKISDFANVLEARPHFMTGLWSSASFQRSEVLAALMVKKELLEFIFFVDLNNKIGDDGLCRHGKLF